MTSATARIMLFSTLAAVLAVMPAFAAQDVDLVSQGRNLARMSCMGCHANDATTTVAPGFAAIGAMPSATELSIKVFLRSSHRNMPNIVLDERQIDALAAYILDRGGK